MLNKSFVRFAIVGVANTAIDVVLFLSLRKAGGSILFSNIISTSVALVFSFTLNHKFTFKSQGDRKNMWALFLVVTLFGLWVIQPIIIKLLTEFNDVINYTAPFIHVFGDSINFEDLIPKLISIAVTLVWNYVLYSKFVFAKAHHETED